MTRRSLLATGSTLYPLAAILAQESDGSILLDWSGVSPGVAGNAARLIIPAANRIIEHSEPSPQTWAAIYGAISAMFINFEESGLNARISPQWREILRRSGTLDRQRVAAESAKLGLTVSPGIWARAEKALHTPGAITEWRTHLASLISFIEQQAVGGVHPAIDPHRYFRPHPLLPVQDWDLTFNPWWAVGGFGLILLGAAAIATAPATIAGLAVVGAGAAIAGIGVAFLIVAA